MVWLPAMLVALLGASAQETPRQEAVRVGAVVTDSRGRPLTDLGPRDFDVRSGGVAQAISGVELRRLDASARRTFALFLDEFHVTEGPNAARVREALLRFVDTELRPGDRVAVMKPLDSQTAIALTSDRTAIRSAVETFVGRAGDYAPRTDFERQYIGHAPDAVRAARTQIVTAALRALSVRLGEAASGRTAIALVSEGFGAGGRADRERRLPDVQTVARLSNRFDVAIYPLDPSAGADDARASAVERLRALASETGGEFAAGDGLPAGLERMTRDLESYYVVTFQPQPRSDGRFLRLEVTSRRGGAIVRAPGGFWMPAPQAVASADAPAAAPRVLRRSGLIQTWTGVARLADGRMRMRVTWEPVLRRAAPRAPSTVVVRAAANGSRQVLFDGRLSPVGRASAAAAAPALAEFIVPSGRVELDLTIFAGDGAQLDAEARDVDVPDARTYRPVAVNPEVVRARTAREFASLSVDPAAPPTAAREFRRADRLLVRAPVLAADGRRLSVSARLLNRWGQPMRDLAPIPYRADAMVQFDLPLAWLAAGEYEIEVSTKEAGGDTSLRIPVKVTG